MPVCLPGVVYGRWNVYDAINVYRTYGVGSPTPTFNDTMFAKIQQLAYWLETAKMRSNLTSNLLGGVPLADLAAYLQAAAAAAAAGSPVYYKLLSLSGHYNTQLGVLAALQLDTWAPAASFTWFGSIPKLAAVMAFELHAVRPSSSSSSSSTSPAFYVRLVAQDGPSAAYTTIPLPCASDAATAAVGAGACGLQEFLSYVSVRALNTTQWCTACGNTDVTACQLATALQQVRQLSSDGQQEGLQSSGSGSRNARTESWKIAVSVVVTFVGTVLLIALGVAVWAWRWRELTVSGSGSSGNKGAEGPMGHQGHELAFTHLHGGAVGTSV
ncbi:hypothetical protein Agub_g13018 [Astrephomene gubernaculifera]|uniref:Uncharacterized protein n=1 Tax=Astrephomene gubernaculifera TaxID=47775 RepID=A0AAD3HS11_9CHLO|nr:hypothetical protein Agub_g13018 [Astrephomene gubernaculifera]